MLGCTCTIHLGIQWPRIRCSRSYAQHQHGRLQGLCPTIPIIFSCDLELHARHKGKYSCAQEFLAQQKSSITHVLQSSSLNTNHKSLVCSKASSSTQNISSVMCFRVHAQHKQAYIYIYISSIIGLRPIYKTNHHVHMKWHLWTNIKIKHQDNHHNQ